MTRLIKNKHKYSGTYCNIHLNVELNTIGNCHKCTRMVRYYGNVKLGFCPHHSRELIIPGTNRCKLCSTGSSKRRQDLLKLNKCAGHPNSNVVEGTTKCQLCWDNNKIREATLLAKGKCAGHVNEDIIPGTTHCKICDQQNKDRVAAYLAAGKCSHHQNENIVEGTTMCQICIDRRKRVYDTSILNKECCNHPGVPAAEDYVLCEDCMETQSWYDLLKRYNISEEMYKNQANKQDNKCLLCEVNCRLRREKSSNPVFNVDHEHKDSRLVRGLLCPASNLMIGKYKDNYSKICLFLDKAEEYSKTVLDIIDIERYRLEPYLACEEHTGFSVNKNANNCEECAAIEIWRISGFKYGWTKERYMEEYWKREGKCDICGDFSYPACSGYPKGSIIHVDHNHDTNIIRGFLCWACNTSIGSYKEDWTRVNNTRKNLKDYLNFTHDLTFKY